MALEISNFSHSSLQQNLELPVLQCYIRQKLYKICATLPFKLGLLTSDFRSTRLFTTKLEVNILIE